MTVYALTLITTELLSNAAAVALLLPIAANLAPGLQLPPMQLITAVVFAASQSFLSPIGYQTNLMVFARGRYRFLDVLLYDVNVPTLLLVGRTSLSAQQQPESPA